MGGRPSLGGRLRTAVAVPSGPDEACTVRQSRVVCASDGSRSPRSRHRARPERKAGRDVIFARLGKGYVGLWDTGAVEMRDDQIRRRSGELHAELSVSSAATPVGHGAIHRASFNVSSSTTRERLGKTLADRSRLPIQWSDYLE